MRGWVNLRSHLAIFFNQNRYKDVCVWSHYNRWPTQMKVMVSLWWVTYPKKNLWSHCDGWPTQMQDDQNVDWSYCHGWPTQIKGGGLIMMGDLSKWKIVVSLWWVTYPEKMMVSLWWVTYPEKWWSHCDGWPTQVEKMMVSLWWVTYPSGKWWSHYDGWPTQKKWWWSHYDGWPTQMKDVGLIMMGDLPRKNNDGLIMMGDLPKWKMNVSLWWVTYPNERWWSHYDGWPTQIEDGKCEVVSLL